VLRFRQLLPLLIGSTLFAQPYISYRAIVNAASSMPGGLPGGSIAQGSIFSLYGTGLGPAANATQVSFPLQTTLADVSIQVQQGATSVNAVPLFVSASQINAIMPSAAPLGKVQLRVSYKGAKSNPGWVNVVPASFGIFTVSGMGFGPGAVLHSVSAKQMSVNSLLDSASPGQTVIFYGTGLGPVSSDITAPAAGNLSTKVEVFVGGVAAQTSYSGRSPCCSGLDQIDFQIPASAPLGCYVPIQVRTNGTVVSNAVTIAIQNGGGACSDNVNPALSAFMNGKNIGIVALSRSLDEWQGAGSGSDIATDLGLAFFFQASASQWFFNPLFSSPAPGTCMVYTGAGDFVRVGGLPGSGPLNELTAGSPLSVTGATGSGAVATVDGAGVFGAPLGTTGFDGVLGSYPTGITAGILAPGPVSVSGPAGSAVGKFSSNSNASAPLTWTNRDQISTIDRSQPLTLTWSGGSPSSDQAFIGAWSSDLPSNSSAGFVCTVPSGEQSFTIPAYVLSNLPASRSQRTAGILSIGLSPGNGSATFSASGLDAGYLVFASATRKTVMFQ